MQNKNSQKYWSLNNLGLLQVKQNLIDEAKEVGIKKYNIIPIFLYNNDAQSFINGEI